jgi:hypothetical protein
MTRKRDRVHSTPSNIETAIANGVAFVLPTGILQQDFDPDLDDDDATE